MTKSKLILLLAITWLRTSAALAGESSAIGFDSLPDTVKTAALSVLDKPNITKITQINEHGLIRFEIEADKIENNHNVVAWDLVIAGNGKIMKLAKEIPFLELTYPQMEALEQRYPGIKVTEAESVDVHFYDVVATINGRKVNLRLYEDGLIEEQPANP